MISDKDIERAITLFTKWDLERKWKKPEEVFINHLREKVNDCLDTAKLLMGSMNQKDFLLKILGKDHFNPTLWIINPSYYSIFLMPNYY